MDNATARACWTAGDWATLAPFLASVARASVRQRNTAQRCSADDVDDIVQRAVIRCWARDAVPPHPAHFVARVAHTIFLDHCRSARVRGTDTACDVDTLADPTTDHTPLDRLTHADDRAAVRAAIETLQPMRTRHCVLYYAAGDPLATIATALDTTEGAIKMLLNRARTELRDALRDPTRDALRVTVHAKRHDTVEVRVFCWRLTESWDRIGTMNVARALWQRSVKPLLIAGAKVHGTPLTIDEGKDAAWMEAA